MLTCIFSLVHIASNFGHFFLLPRQGQLYVFISISVFLWVRLSLTGYICSVLIMTFRVIAFLSLLPKSA